MKKYRIYYGEKYRGSKSFACGIVIIAIALRLFLAICGSQLEAIASKVVINRPVETTVVSQDWEKFAVEGTKVQWGTGTKCLNSVSRSSYSVAIFLYEDC